MTTYSGLLPVAAEAVELARGLISHRSPGAVRAKGDRDMASETDYAVERAVRRFLSDATPRIGFLGEEEGLSGPAGDLRWILDPVDGTANFLHKLPLFAVSLALVDGEHPVLGVVDLPMLGNRYTAVLGQGAEADGVRIHVSRTERLADAVVSLGDYAVGDNAEQRNEPRLALTALLAGRAKRLRMFGSAAIDLAWLAHGRTDAVIILSNHPWDMAAGVVIAREAGAAVVDGNGDPHTFDSRATIAAAPHLVDEVLDLVRRAAGASHRGGSVTQ